MRAAGIKVSDAKGPSNHTEIWHYTEDLDKILNAKEEDLKFVENEDELESYLNSIWGGEGALSYVGSTRPWSKHDDYKVKFYRRGQPEIISDDPGTIAALLQEHGPCTVKPDLGWGKHKALEDKLLERGCIVPYGTGNYSITFKAEFNPKKAKRKLSSRKSARRRVLKKGQIKIGTLHSLAVDIFDYARKGISKDGYHCIRLNLYYRDSREHLFFKVMLAHKFCQKLGRVDSLRRKKLYKDQIKHCYEFYEGLKNHESEDYQKFARWLKREYNTITRRTK